MTYLMEIDNLGKRYDDFELSGVSLAVEPGCVVGFIGSNGAGKTTTIKAVLGDHRRRRRVPCACSASPSPAAAPSWTPSNPASASCWTPAPSPTPAAWAMWALSGGQPTANGTPPSSPRCATASTWLPKKKVSELSRGMGMKLTLAFALSHNPELLVLDEATAGLDPIARDEVLDLLRDFMAEGDRGILMSTHITSDLEKIADEVVCVDAGRIVFTAPKDAITDEAGVARCRAADVTAILDAGFFAPGEARILRHDYGCDVLAPDRFAFARAFPDIPVDKATIEDYMTLILKGESR